MFEPEIARHHGQVFKLMGDGLLAEFGSVVDAVECAVSLQRGLTERNANVAEDQRIQIRIGINLGEVIVEGDDRFGEGVNIAARLEQLADPGGICVSGKVAKEVEKKLAFGFESMGAQKVKNIAELVQAYRVKVDGVPTGHSLRMKPSSFRNAAAVVAGLIVGGVLWNLYPHSATAPVDAPAVAVLPFTNISGDPGLDYFADGVTQTLTAGLSRSPEIRVVARTSAAAYKGKAIDVRQIGRELGARYVLEGSVQKGDDRVRIVAQLIDASTGDHVWAERYEGAGTDALALQDEVTEKVLGSTAGRHGLIRKKEFEQAWGKDRASLDEYDYFLRASQLITQFTKEGTLQAMPIQQEGLNRHPGSALLRISSAWAHYQLFYGGWLPFTNLSNDPSQDYFAGRHHRESDH